MKYLMLLFEIIFYVASYYIFGFEVTVMVGIVDIICYLKIWSKK